jgi:hypothetical protein
MNSRHHAPSLRGGFHTASTRSGHSTAEIARPEAVIGRFSCDLGTGAVSCSTNFIGDISKSVAPLRQKGSSFSTTYLAAWVCGRTLANPGRAVWRHSCSGAWRSSAPQRRAVCALKESMPAQGCCQRFASLGDALCRQHALAGTGGRRRCGSCRRGLQRPEHAVPARITVVVGHAGRALLFNQHHHEGRAGLGPRDGLGGLLGQRWPARLRGARSRSRDGGDRVGRYNQPNCGRSSAALGR